MSMIHPVILCGGSGTRLWPLSRESFPKQFVPLVGGKSLLQATLARVKAFASEVLCVANHEHRFLVREALEAESLSGFQLLEPVGRNTAAAMAAAALNASPDHLLLFLPADHFIPDALAFQQTVRRGIEAAQAGHIVTFGVQPSFPSTAYGYIRAGDPLPGEPGADAPAARAVAAFVEKPEAGKAQQMLLAGGHFWNAGIFLTRADTLIAALQRHAPDILVACQRAVALQTRDGSFVRLDPAAFAACRGESIDYAVMEHHDRVAVVPFSGAWSDVGSWNAVADLATPDADGNAQLGQGLAVQARRTYIHAPHRPVVALGTQDLLIIDTPDAVLVADRSHAELVKTVVSKLKETKLPQAGIHRKVARPWGWYDCIEEAERFKVKRIQVKPGASLSLQKHHHRAEHWVVVKGTAEVTCGDKVILLTENQSAYIPLGEVHRLANPGTIPLEIIEVQSGSYLGEDDIVRLDDTYGRNQKTIDSCKK